MWLVAPEQSGNTPTETIYRITEFKTANDVDPYIPRLVDFSFVLNEAHPKQSPFLLLCSMDPAGPQVENRLVFTHDILPPNTPGALWIGRKRLLDGIVRPLFEESLRKAAKDATLTYDGEKTLRLAGKASLGKPDGDHPTDLLEFTVVPSGGQLDIVAKSRVREVTFMQLSFTATVNAHFAARLSEDGSMIEVNAGTDGEPHTEPDGGSIAMVVIGTILSGGLLGAVLLGVGITGLVAGGETGAEVDKQWGNKLKEGVGLLNMQMKRVPSLQDVAVGGHLVFSAVTLKDSGEFFMGVKDTKQKDS